MRDALVLFDPGQIAQVAVVPNFISEGYFTETVIPRELELRGRVTQRENGQVWRYCPPVGSNQNITDLLLERAADVAPNVDPQEATLLIVAHGTDLNDNSAVAAKREADKIRALHRYAAVLNVYMEEAPLVADWSRLTSTGTVVVVPFFTADGLHTYQDIPELLGIADAKTETSVRPANGCVFRRNPYSLAGRNLFYAPSLGSHPRMAELILAQAQAGLIRQI
jgi:sirohydrochlorin cobaltochelatase